MRHSAPGDWRPWRSWRSLYQSQPRRPYVPYFGKNQIHYDKFEWFIYETDHFVIYYYPEIEQHLERIAGYAESAYQQISSDLKHDLAHKVPLILFKTHSEFEQQNVDPGRGAGRRRRVRRAVSASACVMPIDEPPDRLYGLIVHELTHQFEFDIIPHVADPPRACRSGSTRGWPTTRRGDWRRST